MKIEEKRKVIEVLLCAASKDSLVSIAGIQLYGWNIAGMATEKHSKVNFESWTYEEEAVEAAYRLIETSATLRREWFGARR
jgi:hypothetical protein